jgi:signal transduction histidine kinase
MMHSLLNRDPTRAPTATATAISGAAVVVATVLTLLIQPWMPFTQMALYFGAVLIAAALGGLVLGVFAVLVSILMADAFVVAPAGLGSTSLFAGQFVVWAVVALVLVWVVHRMRRAQWALAQAHADAERMAAQLGEQAAELELQVSESESMAQELEEVNAQLAAQTDGARRSAVRAERLQRFAALLHERVGAAGIARHIVDEGRRALEATAAAVLGTNDLGRLDVLASHGYDDHVVGPDAYLHRGATPLADAARTGQPVWLEDDAALERLYPALVSIPKVGRSWAALPLRIEQRTVGAIALSFARPGPFHPEDRAFMQLVAQQCAQALERARLHEMELNARIRAEFAERRLAFLAEASGRLSASLDYLATLANLAHIAVPEIADWCIVHLLDDDGVLRLVAATHTDPDLAARRRELEERYPPTLDELASHAQVLRTGDVVHIETVSDQYLRSIARDATHLDHLREFDLRSLLCVPLMIEDRAAGAVTLANAESGRSFGENDITLALELGRRAGNAVENARLYQAAHHASETKSDFLAVMSHELRTPLNAIIGYSDLLLMGVPDGVPERARRQIERIRIASTSLLHLVEEVLSFSRVEAGKEEIRISPVDLPAVLRECLTMIEPLAAEKNIELEFQPGSEPLKVVSDERKIRQIMTNLLSNAVKFTERGTITVSMRQEDGMMLIAVHDTGIGISPEHQERIFDPFWQVEQSATRRFGGTGLGLGVARKLAKLLEGRLEVQSTPDVGSVFTLALPTRMPGFARTS